jgi:hypothetical protein
MKKIKYRNNNYNNQVYSINYKFDSVSPAGKYCGTALDLIKKYNELAKEAQANGNYVESEVFRQYAEHYRKIVTEINERKNNRFSAPNKETENSDNIAENIETPENQDTTTETSPQADVASNENTLIETKAKTSKKSFTVVEVSAESAKPKRPYSRKNKKETPETAVNE